MDKTVATAQEAVADIVAGSTIAVGGFGLCGIPSVLLEALLRSDADDLEVFSNNAGVEGAASATAGRRQSAPDRRIVFGLEQREFARQFLSGELEVELTPQGTLAERMRAGGSGIPAFFTATGVGTQVADGGLPWKYGADGSIQVTSPVKDVRTFPTTRGYQQFAL